MDKDRINLIHKRNSYKYFSGLYEWCNHPRTPDELLYKIHDIIDMYRGFRSQTNSECAYESINLILEENK